MFSCDMADEKLSCPHTQALMFSCGMADENGNGYYDSREFRVIIEILMQVRTCWDSRPHAASRAVVLVERAVQAEMQTECWLCESR